MQIVKKIAITTAILLNLNMVYATNPAYMLPNDWYPESITHDSQGNFYVSSWHQGAVVKISKNTTKILVEPGSNQLSNGQGVLVDEKRNILWVCSGKIGFTSVPQVASALKSYNLSTGKPIKSYALPMVGHCNDLAIDNQNRIYVTDSLNPQILRLDNPDSELKTWINSNLFRGNGPFIGLNGIAIKDNHVYVSRVEATNGIATIDINGNAQNPHWLSTDRVLKNVDSVRIVNNNQLLLNESDAFGTSGSLNGQITLASINPDKNSLQLKTIAAGLTQPSSATLMNNKIYYIQSKYPVLLESKGDLNKIPKNVPFTIESVDLK